MAGWATSLPFGVKIVLDTRRRRELTAGRVSKRTGSGMNVIDKRMHNTCSYAAFTEGVSDGGV